MLETWEPRLEGIEEQNNSAGETSNRGLHSDGAVLESYQADGNVRWWITAKDLLVKSLCRCEHGWERWGEMMDESKEMFRTIDVSRKHLKWANVRQRKNAKCGPGNTNSRKFANLIGTTANFLQKFANNRKTQIFWASSQILQFQSYPIYRI